MVGRVPWLALRMGWYRIRYEWPLRRAARNPDDVQRSLLRRILRANQGARFGREHHFSDIRSYSDFLENVPVQTYETLQAYIEDQAQTRRPALTREEPLLYAQTSGTSGAPKYIPIVPSTLQGYQNQQRLLAARQYWNSPRAFSGRILALLGPGIEGYLASGQPYGSVSGFLFERLPPIVRKTYVVPGEVFSIHDPLLKYKTILTLALAEPRITQLAAVNPSSLLRLLAILNEHRGELLDSIATGDAPYLSELSPDIKQIMGTHLKADLQRAEELRRVFSKATVNYADIWPGISLLTTWTGGSCGLALGSLKRTLPNSTLVFELGYISSEFRGTHTLDCADPGGLPSLTDNFFEFVQRDAWEAGSPQFLTLGQLQLHQDYYVVVTNHGGLYRYFINDIVRVVGHYRRTPLLIFVQKGKGATSITGEKLYEAQLQQAIRACEKHLDFSTLFFMGLADESALRYELYIEAQFKALPGPGSAAQLIDTQLQNLNLEYAAKRQSGRLTIPSVHWLKPGTSQLYAEHCINRGLREAQLKPILLQYKRELVFSFQEHLIEP